MYKWQQVKAMKKQGFGIRKIARAVNLSRNTVRKYLGVSDPPKFKCRTRVKKLDAYRDEIHQMFAKGFIGTRVHRELKALGYSGCVDTIQDYLRTLRNEESHARLATTRVETQPGEQMQYDWKEWVLSVAGVPVKVYIHSVILGYSRKKHHSFSLSITEVDVIRANEAALFFFEGAARSLWIDNPKQMILTHRKDGAICYNESFLKFCGLYGIDPIPCQPYRARTKGKVERPFFFVQEHLLRGLEVETLAEFEGKLALFTHESNQQNHSALGEAPEVRFQRDEKAQLLPVPHVEPTRLYPREMRKVTNDGYVHYRGGYYPVPMRLCLSFVWVESVWGRCLRVFEKTGALACELEIHLTENKQRAEHPEHAALNARFQENRIKAAATIAAQFVSRFGASGEKYIQGLRKTVGLNSNWHLHEIMSYCTLHDSQEVRAALETCLEIGSYHKNTILRLLDPTKIKPPHPNRVEVILPKADITRALSDYAGLAEVSA